MRRSEPFFIKQYARVSIVSMSSQLLITCVEFKEIPQFKEHFRDIPIMHVSLQTLKDIFSLDMI